MVNVANKICAHRDCTKRPSFGMEGSKLAEFCSAHKAVGMVDVKNKRCIHHGCTKQSGYGVPGSNKKEFCSEHKKSGMVHAKRNRCGHHVCTKHPVFGVAGTKTAEFCSEHKADGMVYVTVHTRRTAWWTSRAGRLATTVAPRHRTLALPVARRRSSVLNTRRMAW